MPESISKMIANTHQGLDLPFEKGLIHQRSAKQDDLHEQIQLSRCV
jgi:hypothetical protein